MVMASMDTRFMSMNGGVFTREPAVGVIHHCWGDSHFLGPGDEHTTSLQQ